MISKLKKARRANASFRGGIKASLLDVIDSINKNEENERQELSEVISSTGKGGVVETIPEGAPNKEVEVIHDMDDDESVAAVETSNCKGKSKHPTKKKKKSQKKKAKSKKNRGANSCSSNTVVIIH